MLEFKLLIVLFFAIAIGWLLGKFPFSKYWRQFKNRSWRKSYMEGIHLLLDEKPDHAIESFIERWDVNSENFDLHNALANMLSKKGEVDRAIRIHGNLLDCEKLNQAQTRQVTIDLANDYIKAGLLDRAERLLINVVNNSKEFEERALELLQQIYQLEKEWNKAIIVAEQLAPKRSVAFEERTLSSGKQLTKIAHYYCELAESALIDDNFHLVEMSLENALSVDKQCSRALLLKAKLASQRQQIDRVLEALAQLKAQDPHLLVEALPVIQVCFEQEPQQWLSYLKDFLTDYPSVAIEKVVYEALISSDEFEANEFLTQAVKKRPTLQGLELLLQEQLDVLHGAAKENLLLLHRLVTDVLKDKPSYQCRSCGFSGHHLYWLCPQCQSWDTVRRIRGSEGD